VSNLSKVGTPTMGGLMILAGIGVAVLLWGDLTNPYIWIVSFVTAAFGVLGAMLAGKTVASPTHADPIAVLTDRGREVLDPLVLGHTNRQIAPPLFPPPRTVQDNHARRPRKPRWKNPGQPPAGCGHGGTRNGSTSRRVQTWSVNPAAIAGVWGCQRFADPGPFVGSGSTKGIRKLACGRQKL